ncbi:MAG: efflux RND transporter permease subunit [Hyphomicrobiales bacterium]|nr:efflux RND transporter permease subunit [Hyphomicrobiales bacterium]
MLNGILRFSLRHRSAIFALALLLLGYGLFALTQARLDVFPEFAPPMAVVQTEAPGLSSAQVETLVTGPIENAVGASSGIVSMRSKSLAGLSIVTLVFKDRADIYRARQTVSERLNTLGADLPIGVHAPRLLPLTTATSVVLVLGLTPTARANPISALQLHDIAQWTLRPQLMSLRWVADAIVFGGDTRQLQIKVDPLKLQRAHLRLSDVIAAAKRATGLRGAGFLEGPNQRIAITTHGQVTSPQALAQVILAWHNGVGLRLSDVAEVQFGAAPAVGAASVQGRAGIMMVVEGQYGSNSLNVTKRLEARLTALQPELTRQGVTLHRDIFRPASFILQATAHLGTALALGAGLVMLILFLFLQNLRTALISATAIPLSLLAAILVLENLGYSLNTMTLGGLAIALGEVVDDAIIDVENIYRRLRDNAALAQPVGALRVVLRACLEVRSAVVFATFTVILIFLPVLTLSGVAGRLFAPLGLAYILAVLASLAVALTLTPALSLALLGNGPFASKEARWLTTLKSAYTGLLVQIARFPRAIIAAVAALCMLALASLVFINTSFIPQLREGHFIVHMGLAPGTSLKESMRVGGLVSEKLQHIQGVRMVAQRAGRASEVVDPVGVQLSEFEVDLLPLNGAGQQAILNKIKLALAQIPGISTAVNTFLTERIDETISGSTAPVVIKVFGTNLDVIDAKAQQIAQVMGKIHGVASVGIDAPPGIPEFSVRLNLDALNQWGLHSLDVLSQIQSAFQGSVVGQTHDGAQTHDIVVSLAQSVPGDIAPLQNLSLVNSAGEAVPLRLVADIRQVAGRYVISHEGGQREETVSVTLGTRAIASFEREARTQIGASVALPLGTYIVFSGENEASQQSQRDLEIYGLLALAGIGLLLAFALKRAANVALVALNLPFALVGGVLGVLLTGGHLSLGGMVGFVTLFGISLRNSIMLISHFQHLVEKEGQGWGAPTAWRGAAERLVPILMTALATGLALLPLAIASGEPGNEIEGPMAIVILGGLVTSTLLNLSVLPIMALRFGRFGEPTRN